MISSTHASAAIDYLKSCLNKRVKNLVRFSWWPAEDVSHECNTPDSLAFSATAGPMAVYFDDGEILGIASDPALNSILIWDEAARRAVPGDQVLERDTDLFQIQVLNEKYSISYWRGIVGCRLMRIDILKKKSMSEKEAQLPSEIGLRLSFDNGSVLIASHGMRDGSDDFSILQEDQVQSEFRQIPIA